MDSHAAAQLDARRRQGIFFVSVAVAAVSFAITAQIGLNDNFLANPPSLGGLGIDGFQKGLIESVRETCGITALLIFALLAGMVERTIAFFAIAVFAIGLGSYFWAYQYVWIVVLSLVWSQGLHVWMPLPNSMMLSLAEPGRTGHRLGQLQAVGSVASAVSLAACWFMGAAHVPIRPLYIMAGLVALVGAFACLAIPRDIKTPGPRFVFRRKYGLYYALCFLEGSRKQIFLAFAGFLLVKKHDTPLQDMILLMAIVQVINWLTSPAIGRLIDRIGERRVLVFYSSCMVIFFIGYALIPSRPALWVLFVLDNALFSLGMALTTYVRKIAPVHEHTPTLSMGVAMNHVAAVTVPLAGAFLWKYIGFQSAFLVGSAIALVGAMVAMKLPRTPLHPAIPEPQHGSPQA
ncbi:MAG: MFS transporter [Lentisphaerae bacterium]|nr:MFS transporter [Lentisphaerota bacterium]